jgi:serine/threonine protein kinase
MAADVAPVLTPSPAPGAASAAGGTPSAADGQITLAGNYVISTSEPVPALSGKAVMAFRAVDRRFPGEALVALICSGDDVLRLETMSAIRGFGKQGVLALKEFGPVNWPGGKQRLAAIHSFPAGGRFTLSGPMRAAHVLDVLLRPAAAALGDIHGRGVTHRAIRPDNLFLRDPGSSVLSLGPCVVLPPGFEQPEIYEPIDCAAADPSGRGQGSPKHDMFALGMTALALLLGRQPGSEYDRDQLMIRRLERGSLAAVIDTNAMPREIVDAIQGLTVDDEADRWTLAELNKWLNAGRPDQPPLQSPARPVSPYTIGGKEVRTSRSLAYMLARDWVEGARQLRSEALPRWVRDHAPERIAFAHLEQAMVEQDPETEVEDREALLVARAVMALDPEGPVRYRGLAVDPHGMGPFLFDAAATPEKRAAAVSLLRYGLAQKTLDRRVSNKRPNSRRTNRQAVNFERLRRWAVSAQPWEGLERCIYDLNVNLPCLSPMTGGRWVSSVADLVMALDDAATSGRIAEPVIDNHIAAFIGARFDATGDALLTLMKPKDADDDARLGAIRLFAELQQSLGSPPLRGIAQWCAKLARRVGEGMHYRPLRQRVLETIDRAVPAGSVATILRAIDMPDIKIRDDTGFVNARSQWVRLELEARAVERNTEARRERARRRGSDNAALASGAGSIFTFIITLFLDSAR